MNLLFQKIAQQTPRRIALFLDVDGTCLNFNDNPEAVTIPETLRQSLIQLHGQLGGAVALVTGRDAKFIDEKFLPGFKIPMSVGHGTHIRLKAGAELIDSAVAVDEAALDNLILQQILPSGVWIEQKPQARAFHWNKSDLPEAVAEEQTAAAVATLVQAYNQGRDPKSFLKAEKGRMVYEIGSASASKEFAVDRFLGVAPFVGRLPVYFGDQPADAGALQYVRDNSGIAVGVGPDAPAAANYHLTGPEQVCALLQNLARHYAAPKPDISPRF